MGIGAAIAGLYPDRHHRHRAVSRSRPGRRSVNEAPNITYMSGGQVKVPVMFHALVGIRISGAAQHSARPQAMLMQVAGLQVIAPARACDVKPLLARPPRTASGRHSGSTIRCCSRKSSRLTGRQAVAARQGRGRAQRQGRDHCRLFDRSRALPGGGRRNSRPPASTPRSSTCGRSTPLDGDTDLRVGRQDRAAGDRGRMLSPPPAWRRRLPASSRTRASACSRSPPSGSISLPCRCR